MLPIPYKFGFVLLQFFGSSGWAGQLPRSLDRKIIFTGYAGAIAAALNTYTGITPFVSHNLEEAYRACKIYRFLGRFTSIHSS